jgi:RNA polymerase sigma-70 factor (ECF subfamily)
MNNGNLGEIYRQFHPKLLHYLSRLVGSDEADDLAQEVFEKASRGLDDFRGESKLSTWLYRIATNTALDRLRSRSSKRISEHVQLETSAGVEDRNIWTGQATTHTDQQIIRKEMSECVRGFVDTLPPDYRTVIVLSELEGLKNREIAEILQVSLDVVKIRLHRARASLKTQLDNDCSFYRTAEGILSCDRKPASLKSKKSD